MRGVGVYGAWAPEQVTGWLPRELSAPPRLPDQRADLVWLTPETARLLAELGAAVRAARVAGGAVDSVDPPPAGELPRWHEHHVCARYGDTVHVRRDEYGVVWAVRECEVCGRVWDRRATAADLVRGLLSAVPAELEEEPF